MKSIICEASSIAKAVEQGWKKAGLPQNFSIKVLEKEEKNFFGFTKKPAKVALFFEDKPELQKKRIDQRSSNSQSNFSQANNSNIKYEKDKSFQENLRSLHDSPQKNVQKPQQAQTQAQSMAKPAIKIQPQGSNQVRVFPQASKPLSENASRTQATNTQAPTAKPFAAQARAQQPIVAQAKQVNSSGSVEQTDNQEDKVERKSPWTEQMVASSSGWVKDMLEKMNFVGAQFSVTVSYNNIRFHFEKSLIDNRNEQKELFRNLAFLLMQTTRYKYKKQFRNLKAVFTSNI